MAKRGRPVITQDFLNIAATKRATDYPDASAPTYMNLTPLQEKVIKLKEKLKDPYYRLSTEDTNIIFEYAMQQTGKSREELTSDDLKKDFPEMAAGHQAILSDITTASEERAAAAAADKGEGIGGLLGGSDIGSKILSGVRDPAGAVETMAADIKRDPASNLAPFLAPGMAGPSMAADLAGEEELGEDYWKAMGVAAGATGLGVVGGALAGGMTGAALGFGEGSGLGLGAGLIGASVIGAGGDYLAGKETAKAEEEAWERNLPLQQQATEDYQQSLTRESRFTPEQIAAQDQWGGLIQAQLSQGAGYQGPPSSLGQQMAAAQQAEYGRQQGEMLGNIGQQRQAAQTSLSGAMRGLYGGATPGLQAAMGGQLEQSYAGPTLAARMMPSQAMQQWKAGQAQQGFQNLAQYAQAPLGNLPQGYNQPLFPPTDYSGADMWGAIGDLGQTALLGGMMGGFGGGGQQNPASMVGTFAPPTSLYPSQNTTQVPWQVTPASMQNPYY